MLEFDKLSYCIHSASQGQEGLRPILNEVSLRVPTASIVGILGPSGCGKSTLFNCAAGLKMPTSGAIYLDGKKSFSVPERSAYMLQNDMLLPTKTVLDNVALPLRIRGVPKHEARRQALQSLKDFHLETSAHNWPRELSGGMRQRVSFVRATLSLADHWLLDEPFSALDAFTKASMHEWFLRLQATKELTTLLITHDIEEALLLCDSIAVMAGNPSQGIPGHIVCVLEINRQELGRFEFVRSSFACDVREEIYAALSTKEDTRAC